jgi:hypothetical protein
MTEGWTKKYFLPAFAAGRKLPVKAHTKEMRKIFYQANIPEPLSFFYL